MALHHRTCNLCEANCGLLIETAQARITSIHADPDDPLSQGYICPKAYALKDAYEDPDRLRRPLLREGTTWREVAWDEALTAAAQGLHQVQKRHGEGAVASYIGNPTVHNMAAMLAVPPFLRLLGGRNRFSATSVDQAPKMLSSFLLFGGQMAIPVPDVDRTDYLLILGANPLVSNGSMMTAPGMKRRLRALRDRGGRVVVVDPRRSETAAAASEHVFLYPGTDSLFLLALLSVLFAEDLVRPAALAERIEGIAHLAALARAFAPERVATATGVAADTIRRIARELSAAPTAVCYTRIGACVQEYGTLTSYLGDVVNLVTGNLDRAGGAMFPKPAAAYPTRGSYQRWRSRVRGLPEFGGELPVACLSEEIETGGPGQIRGMITLAGNPVLSTPNGARLEAAMGTLDFMVSVDPALNETTRLAHVILPPRHSLENPHFSLVFHKLAVRDTVKFSEPLFPPAADSLSEWEILGRLAAELVRLRSADSVAAGGAPVDNPAAAQFSQTPTQLIAMLLAGGSYGVSLKDVQAKPSGIDLGAMKEGGLERELRHGDGKVHLTHACIDAEVARLGAALAEGTLGGSAHRADDAFLLIGRRQLRSNNSWMHNCASLIKGPERCTLLMHPQDAARLSLREGALVTVKSRTGSVVVPLQLTDEMMPGVVSMPHGFGHTRQGTRMQLAAARPGASMNDLTDELRTEGLVGNGILTGVPVSVSA